MANDNNGIVHPTEESEFFKIGKEVYQTQITDDEPTKQDGAKPDLAAQMVALQKQLLDTQKQNVELLRLATTPKPVVANNQPEELPELDLEGLPDPTMDRAGFLKGVAERFNVTLSQATQIVGRQAEDRINSAVGQKTAVDDAWSDMRERYPDIAKHRRLIYSANEEVVKELREQNIDPNLYMAQQTSKYVDKVAEQARDILKELGVGTQSAADDGSSDDDGRTAGIPSGRAGGTARGARRPKEVPGNFVNELKKIQADNRIY